MALPNEITLGTDVFKRIREGYFLKVGSTLSLPDSLEIRNTLRPGQRSEYVIIRKKKVAGALPGTFRELQAHTVIKADDHSTIVDDMQAMVAQINTLVAVDATLADIFVGNR